VCQVRSNHEGRLRIPWGYVSGLALDPIEKKPFFHVLPGEPALSFGMLGCDLHCGYCQNWISSQVLRDEDARASIHECEPGRLVELAREKGSRVLVSTYNEPLITAEWAVAVFEPAKREGLLCGFVSNGNATPEVLDYLRPHVDLYKVDLKGFDDRAYRSLGGTLAAVLETLEGLKRRGFWVEVVTLVVPGFNDDPRELRAMARFLAGLDPLMPWHLTAFHPDYRMSELDPTPLESLLRAREIAGEEGMRYVYLGNLPHDPGGHESTHCHGCGARVVQRRGFRVEENRIRGGACPDCGQSLPGIWELGH
jgi:pyruvate formate lyase activating enzyme